MADFDPDKYLAEAATPAPAFDPDAYLAQAAASPQYVAPTAFLSSREPEGAVRRTLRTAREALSPLIGPTENQRLDREQKVLALERDLPQLAAAAPLRPNLVEEEGFIPAAFTPSEEAPLLIPRMEGDAGGARAVGRGIVNATTGAINSMTSSPGGLLTLGAGGLVAPAMRAGTLTPATTRAVIATEGAFAADQARQLVEGFGSSARAAREITAGEGDAEANAELLAGQALNTLTLGLAGGDAARRIRQPRVELETPIRTTPELEVMPRVAPEIEATSVAAPEIVMTPPEAPSTSGQSLAQQFPDIFNSKPENDTPILIRAADGTQYPATINGYYDLGNGDVRASIGRSTPDGWSHGLLRPGEEIVSSVPSPEEWATGIRDIGITPDAPAIALESPVDASEPQFTVEPLGSRYLVMEGVGEPVEQFQVKRPGEERGITMTRADLEANGIPVPEQALALSDSGAPPIPPESAVASFDGGQSGLPAAPEKQTSAGAGGPPAVPPSGIVPTSPGPPPSNNPIPRSIWNSTPERVWGELKRKFVDFASPIEDTARRIEREEGFTLDPNSRISNYIDRSIRAPQLSGQFVRDSGLANVIQQVADVDDFGNYLIDKHALDVEANGKNSGRDLTAARANIAAKGPQYAAQEAQLRSASDALLGLSVNYGLIAPETAAYLNDLYPNYVPFDRVFDAFEKNEGSAGRRGVASLSRQTAIRELEGSDRPIENPLGSILKKVEDVYVQGERNIAARTLASYADLPGWNELIREVPKGKSAKNTFSFLDDGVKRTFEAPAEIAEAAKNLNQQQLGPVMAALSIPMRLFKLGTTGINPVFAAKNIVRDLQSTAVQSPNSAGALLAMPKALFEAVGHGATYDDAVRAAGVQTSFDILRNEPMQSVERIRSERSVPSKIAYTATRPLEMLRAVEDIVGRTEEFGRIQNYIAGYEDAIKQGLPPEEAMTQGARYARETTANFARRGEWSPVINALWPYFNANIQGVRGTVRALRRAPFETAAKWTVGLGLPVAAATLWNLSTPERKEAWEDIPEYEKENNIILLPENPQKDDKGRWNAIKIPLSPGLGRATNLMRRPIEALNGQDPVAFAEMARSLLAPGTPIDPEGGSLASNSTPIIGRPLLEARLNKNFYTSQPIVPERLKDLAPELQFDKNTSRAAIQIGNAIGVSPMKVDHIIRGYGGEVASNFVNAYDRTAAESIDDITGTDSGDNRVGGRSIPQGFERGFATAAGGNMARKFYEYSNAAQTARESFRQFLINGQDAQADAYYRQNEALINAAPALTSIRRQLSTVGRLERSNAEADTEDQKAIRNQKDEMTRIGVETIRQLEKDLRSSAKKE